MRLPGSGYALVLVLWIVGILTLISGIAFSSARTEALLARGHIAALEGKALRDAGLWAAISDATMDSSRASRRQQEMVLFGNLLTVQMQDVAGQINLNHAPGELLLRLLMSTSLTQAQAETVGYMIADWIDPDSESVLGLDEASIYRNAGLDYTPANRPFSTVSELRLVAHLTDEVFREIEPFLTLYGTHEYLNSETADPQLLERLRSTRVADSSWEARYLSASTGNVFAITSSLEIDGNLTQTRAIVEFLPGADRESFRILTWDE